MTSSIKDTFPSSNSWVSRAGVIVGYKPEDTMKSFLFNQNNRHCINSDDDEMSILRLPQSEIEKALEFLSSDSESESSSMTKITVKQISDISNDEEEKIHLNINAKSGSDLEIWNKNNHSDAECTSADISNDFGDRISSITQSKTFEEIIEEKLKDEVNKAQTQRDNTKSDSGTKPKFSFLKKNAGRAAWCSNTRPSRDANGSQRAPKSTRSQSNDTQKNRKVQDVSLLFSSQNSQQQKAPVRRMKSLNNVHVVKQPDGPKTQRQRKNVKQGQKTVHFAATCLSGSESEIGHVTVTQVNQKASEIEDHSLISSDDNQDPDKDLVEFELLEEIANVSISSSVVSSIAMYDEENLRAKLQKFKTPKHSVYYSQDKYYDSQRVQSLETNKPTTIDRNFHNLSTCEERTENITNSSNVDLDADSDDNSQNTSVNSTTLSEFKEPNTSISNNFTIQPEKMQVFTRKIAKPKEHSKSITQELEEVEENPFHLENNSCPTVPLKPLHVNWSFADPFHLSDSSNDEDEQPNKTDKPISKPNLEMCPLYPTINVDKQQSNPDDNIAMQSSKLKQWVQLLENEVKRFKSENEEIENLKKEKEDGLKRLEEEMRIFKKFKDDEMKKIEDHKQNELKKLRKERKVFDDYQEAMKHMPNKKDRQEIDDLRSEIEGLKEELSNKENRWQAANSRLKLKVDQLETENSELHSRIHALEQKRLHLQAQLVTNSNQKLKPENHLSKPKQTVTSVSQAVSMKHSNIPLGLVPKEDNNNNKCAAGSSKLNNPTKKNSSKPVNSNLNKPQKTLKNTSNPFSLENNGTDIRGSAASDYYTGEEENGSVDLKLNKQNTFPKNKFNDSELTAFHIPDFSSSAKIDRSNEIIKEEIHHPDGILERVYKSGSVDITYSNGSLKQISSDNKSIVVHLYNGDIKQTTPDGRVIYYYAQDQSTQTTYPNGKEEILYKNGHKETMHPSGIREIHFPDQSVKILHPDSTEETFLPNGLVIRINNSGDKEILLPNGQKEIHANGIKKRIYPDGTTKTVYLDGRQETFYASGRMRVKDKNGNLILDQYMNKTNLLTSSG